MARINKRFKRVVINRWETEQVEKASTWLKKIEVYTWIAFQFQGHWYLKLRSLERYFMLMMFSLR
uniref:Uncharacterized protein n=1 Tax=Arundo donax TaxID=35708 RepID=A0A0A9FZ69_ARUDO